MPREFKSLPAARPLLVLSSAGSGLCPSYPYSDPALISEVLFRAPSPEFFQLWAVAPVPVLPAVAQLGAGEEQISQEAAVAPEVCAVDPSAAAEERGPVAVRSDFRGRED